MQMLNQQELSIITTIPWRSCLKLIQQIDSIECVDSAIYKYIHVTVNRNNANNKPITVSPTLHHIYIYHFNQKL